MSDSPRYPMTIETRQAARALAELRSPFPRNPGKRDKARRFIATMKAAADNWESRITAPMERWLWVLVNRNRRALDDEHGYQGRRYFSSCRGEDPDLVERKASE